LWPYRNASPRTVNASPSAQLETPYPNRNTAKPKAMTQVVSLRTTVQKQPGRSVGHNHLVALIPAISMLARATTRMILVQSA